MPIYIVGGIGMAADAAFQNFIDAQDYLLKNKQLDQYIDEIVKVGNDLVIRTVATCIKGHWSGRFDL